MNRNTLLAWIALMGLMLFWTTYKQKQVMAENKAKQEQQRIDSLSHVNAALKAHADSLAKGLVQAPAQGPAGQTSGNAALSSGSSAAGVKSGAAAVDSQATVHRKITVETHKFIVQLDNEGAKVSSLTLKELAERKPYNATLIAPEKGGALTLSIENQDLSKSLWQTDAKDSLVAVDKEPVTISFKYVPAQGQPILTRTFTFFPDSAKFSQHLESSSTLTSYSLNWPSGLGETEKIVHGKGVGLMTNYFSELIMDNGGSVQRNSFVGKKTFNEESGVLRWVGLRRKYMAVVINFNKETTNKVVATATVPEGEDKTYPKEYQVQLVGSNYEEKTLDFDFVVLPLSYDKLLAHNQNYEKIIFSGWEPFFRADVWYPALCGLVLHLLKFFNGLVHNYGVAIIMLTLLVRAITFPLTIAQTKQGVKMQQHTPAIQKIREKYKGNPQKANLEIMEYYKKEGVNPLSGVMGCFPMLLQMPIFISLFNVLGRAVELKNAPFFGWVHDLSLPDVVYTGIQIPYVFPLGVTVLPFFMAATMFFQMKASIKDPNQKFMVWMMPVMMFVFSCSFPSGLVLYWTVSNLFTIGQTYFYTNRLKPKVLVTKTNPAGTRA